MTIHFPRGLLELTLKDPQIAKGGVNRDGMTWAEWYPAACHARKPANMLEESWYGRAWQNGIDPSDMGGAW